MGSETAPAVGGIVAFVLILLGIYRFLRHFNPGTNADEKVLSNCRIRGMTTEKFLSEVSVHEKPFRFKRSQLVGFTRNYSTRLGAGRFGTVFKGALPNGLAVAVKVLRRSLDVDEEQFMAAAGAMWRARHANVVKLFGFCSDDAVRALVYEYAGNGALDAYLLGAGAAGLPVPARLGIAVGVARGIRHLHEECGEKVVHHDIKLGNVLLDAALTPKLADAGLAPLADRADTHVVAAVSSAGGGVTAPADAHAALSASPAAAPGHVAPEVRVPPDITEKRDVYSFGMLLLEIVGRRRIRDEAAPEGERWLTELAWSKYESGKLMDLVVAASPDHTAVAVDDDVQRWKELAERMCKVAFWCVQQQPAARPPMGDVVKMLEGEMDIDPPANPFRHALAAAPVVAFLRTKMASGGNKATAKGDSNGSEVIQSALNIIQSIIQLTES